MSARRFRAARPQRRLTAAAGVVGALHFSPCLIIVQVPAASARLLLRCERGVARPLADAGAWGPACGCGAIGCKPLYMSRGRLTTTPAAVPKAASIDRMLGRERCMVLRPAKSLKAVFGTEQWNNSIARCACAGREASVPPARRPRCSRPAARPRIRTSNSEQSEAVVSPVRARGVAGVTTVGC